MGNAVIPVTSTTGTKFFNLGVLLFPTWLHVHQRMNANGTSGPVIFDVFSLPKKDIQVEIGVWVGEFPVFTLF